MTRGKSEAYISIRTKPIQWEKETMILTSGGQHLEGRQTGGCCLPHVPVEGMMQRQTGKHCCHKSRYTYKYQLIFEVFYNLVMSAMEYFVVFPPSHICSCGLHNSTLAAMLTGH